MGEFREGRVFLFLCEEILEVDRGKRRVWRSGIKKFIRRELQIEGVKGRGEFVKHEPISGVDEMNLLGMNRMVCMNYGFLNKIKDCMTESPHDRTRNDCGKGSNRILPLIYTKRTHKGGIKVGKESEKLT